MASPSIFRATRNSPLITVLEHQMLPDTLSIREKEWVCVLFNNKELTKTTADKDLDYFLNVIKDLKSDYRNDPHLPFYHHKFKSIGKYVFSLRGKDITYAKSYHFADRTPNILRIRKDI